MAKLDCSINESLLSNSEQKGKSEKPQNFGLFKLYKIPEDSSESKI